MEQLSSKWYVFLYACVECWMVLAVLLDFTSSISVYLSITLFWAALGLYCCKQAFSSCTTIQLELRVLVVLGLWDFPRLETDPEPMSPASAERTLIHWPTREVQAPLKKVLLYSPTRFLSRLDYFSLGCWWCSWVPSLRLIILYVDEGSLSSPCEFQPAGSCRRWSLEFAHGCPWDML